VRHKIARLSEKPVDIREFCSRLLPVYIEEAAAIGEDPANTLLASIWASENECYGGWTDSTPVVVFGAAVYPRDMGPAGPNAANLWVIQAAGYERALVGFMRQTRRISDEWARRYGTVYGHIKADNGRMIRFAEWCGFKSFPVTIKGQEYAEVVKEWEWR
jgi:hypothetical protein